MTLRGVQVAVDEPSHDFQLPIAQATLVLAEELTDRGLDSTRAYVVIVAASGAVVVQAIGPTDAIDDVTRRAQLLAGYAKVNL